MFKHLEALQDSIDMPMTILSIGFGGPEDSSGTQILPVVSMPAMKVLLPVWGKDMYKRQGGHRPLRGKPRTVGAGRGTQEFTVEENSLGAEWDVNEAMAAANGQLPWDLPTHYSQLAKTMCVNERNYRIATFLQTPGNYGAAATAGAGTYWDEKNIDGSYKVNPLHVSEELIRGVRAKVGRRPNVGFMGEAAFHSCQFNTNVSMTIFNTLNPDKRASAEDMATWLRLEKLIICEDVQVGVTDVFSDIYADNVGFVCEDAAPLSTPRPCYGFTGVASFGTVGDKEMLGYVIRHDESPWVGGYYYTEWVSPSLAMADAGTFYGGVNTP